MSKCRAHLRKTNTLYAVMVGNSSILLSVPFLSLRVRFTYVLFFTGLGKKRLSRDSNSCNKTTLKLARSLF